MKIMTIAVIISLLTIPMGHAFEFRGNQFDWDSQISIDTIKNLESENTDNSKIFEESEEEIIFAFDDDRFSMALAIYQLYNNKLHSTAYYYKSKNKDERIKDVYEKIRAKYEKTFGKSFKKDESGNLQYKAFGDTIITVGIYNQSGDKAVVVQYDRMDATTQNDVSEGDSIKIMSFVDLKLDYNDLIGKRVAVRGVCTYLNDTFIIGGELNDPNAVVVDIDNMSREDRKYIMTKCPSGCELTVYAIVEEAFALRIMAGERIEK